MRGGAMILSDAGYNDERRGEGQAEEFRRALLLEIAQRSFTALVCDFEQRWSPTLERLVESVAPSLLRRGVTLYVPEAYARCDAETKVLIPTAITQGSLAGRLREATERYGGAARLALDIECAATDLALPSPDNAGKHINRAVLNALLMERGGQSFYSEELCARYFTYREADEHHFVIYDDGGTIQKKAQTALRMGIKHGFVLYPEVESYLAALVN
jgi:hypothetical protein